eukprot:CAMPEP_0184370032 /NCGR_PEP_ID=MMETSP1089-20130417/162588_1 /TAXON_ID=38269 ORGANISM="Gloeochaete wittrockiana, Strain SAG46.84" /NCGR_SAMPLE_ID=MMETSP1089 /ASSEMBLY_ACC=CAM_ASM_000445 /LENGTH=299 /DNA_ID=CAMNT_0026712571 /DNA_START=735 /DNA_END=1630 /DNA_ORIENTATION=+
MRPRVFSHYNDEPKLLKMVEDESSERSTEPEQKTSSVKFLSGVDSVKVKEEIIVEPGPETRKGRPDEGVGNLVWMLLADLKVRSTIAIYALLAFAFIVFDQVFPLWALEPPEHHGVGFTSTEIGISQALGGVVVVTFQIFAYPPVRNFFGLARFLQISMYASFPVLLIAEVSRLMGLIPKLLTWSIVVSLGVWKALVSTVAFTNSILLVNNSSTPQHLGSVNGLGQSFACLARAFGPILGATLFAWSLTNNYFFPLDYRLIFVIIGILFIVILIIAHRLPPSIDAPRVTWDDIEEKHPV